MEKIFRILLFPWSFPPIVILNSILWKITKSSSRQDKALFAGYYPEQCHSQRSPDRKSGKIDRKSYELRHVCQRGRLVQSIL